MNSGNGVEPEVGSFGGWSEGALKKPGCSSNKTNKGVTMAEERCPQCGCDKPKIFVHGHYQCVDCKCNVEECCQGETAQTED